MAELPETFNPEEIPEDDRSFGLLPRGPADMQVIESEIIANGDNQMLKLTIEIISGPNSNRRLWDNLNIRHSNADAQRIAQRALADLCLAIGHTGSLTNSEDLHFKPFRGEIGVKKATQKDIDAGYPDDKNTVRYKAGNAKPPAQVQSAPPAQAKTPAASTNAAKGNKPWLNKQTAA